MWQTWLQGGAMKKKDGKKVAKEEAAQQAALRALANREAHWDTLERARLELESLRMLLERVGRREKVKKQREAPQPALPSYLLTANLMQALCALLRGALGDAAGSGDPSLTVQTLAYSLLEFPETLSCCKQIRKRYESHVSYA